MEQEQQQERATSNESEATQASLLLSERKLSSTNTNCRRSTGFEESRNSEVSKVNKNVRAPKSSRCCKDESVMFILMVVLILAQFVASQTTSEQPTKTSPTSQTTETTTTTSELEELSIPIEEKNVTQLLKRGVLDARSVSAIMEFRQKSTINYQLAYSRKIWSNKKLKVKLAQEHFTDRIYERALDKNPFTRVLVIHNETHILVTRSTDLFFYWEFGQTAATLVIFVMIVVGNISILYRLKSCRRSRSNVNYFILQLAIADLFVGIFGVTLDIVLKLQKDFTYGLVACQASKYISNFFIYSSTYLLVALSIDRWEAVVKPLAFTKNRSRGYYLAGGAWALALVSPWPVLLNTVVTEMQGVHQCWIELSTFGWQLYMVYLTGSLLVVPTVIIAICYVHIVYTIWSKSQLGERHRRQRAAMKRLSLQRMAASHELRVRAAAEVEFQSKEEEEEEGKRNPHEHSLPTSIPPSGQMVALELEPSGVSTDEESAELNSMTEDEVELEQLQLEQKNNNVSSPSKQQTNDPAPTVQIKPFNELKLQAEAENNPRRSKRSKGSGSNSCNNSRNNSKQSKEEKRRDLEALAQQHGSGVIPKARIKTIKMTLVIVAAFVLCWSPFYIINLCNVFGLLEKDSNFAVAIGTLSQSLTHLNSAVNPIIFWLFSSKRNNSTPTTSSGNDTRQTSGNTRSRASSLNTDKTHSNGTSFLTKLNQLFCCFCSCFSCCFCFNRKQETILNQHPNNSPNLPKNKNHSIDSSLFESNQANSTGPATLAMNSFNKLKK